MPVLGTRAWPTVSPRDRKSPRLSRPQFPHQHTEMAALALRASQTSEGAVRLEGRGDCGFRAPASRAARWQDLCGSEAGGGGRAAARRPPAPNLGWHLSLGSSCSFFGHHLSLCEMLSDTLFLLFLALWGQGGEKQSSWASRAEFPVPSSLSLGEVDTPRSGGHPGPSARVLPLRSQRAEEGGSRAPGPGPSAWAPTPLACPLRLPSPWP